MEFVLGAPLHKIQQNNYSYGDVRTLYTRPINKVTPKKKKVKKKVNIFQKLLRLGVLSLFAYYAIPYHYFNFLEPNFINPVKNSNIKADMAIFVDPHLNYINNTELFGKKLYVSTPERSKVLNSIVTSGTLNKTSQELNALFKNYPNMTPHVFVWEYSSGKSFEYDADSLVPAASIIKLPILFELFRKIDRSKADGSLTTTLDKQLFYDDKYRTEGSGRLQFSQLNRYLSIDYLAKIMITQSDNSSTNMLLEEIGGINGFNSIMRSFGLNKIHAGNWLPDYEGTNQVSARELSSLIYNIDNPDYLSKSSSLTIKEYMANVENRSLLASGIPKDAIIIHKTGDIGKMLGDAGIVYTQSGKKYIVSILVERPHNNYGARDLIQKASAIIYNNINSGIDI